MTIQIGNTSYPIPMPALDGSQGADQTKASGQPALGNADLSNINSKQWEVLKNQGDLPLPAARGDAGTPPPGLDGKLEKMSQITDIYSVMALFQEVSQDARSAAREQRHAETQQRMEAMGAAADKMRDAAVKRLIATCVQAGVQAASGAMKIGTAGVSIKGAMKAGKLSAEGQKLSQQAAQTNKIADRASGSSAGTIKQLNSQAKSFETQATSFNNRAQSVNTQSHAKTQIGNGTADIFGSVGTAVKGGLDYSASLDDAAKADLDKEAEMHRAARERANDTMQQMKDIIRDIQAKLSEIERSSNDTAKQITRA